MTPILGSPTAKRLPSLKCAPLDKADLTLVSFISVCNLTSHD